MPRTTPQAVIDVLGDNYGANRAGGLPSLQRHIRSASVVVTRAAQCALDNKEIRLTDEELELMETWLAGHFYCKQDPLRMSKSTSGASGSYQRKVGEGFDTTEYGQAACQIDYSGCLAAIGKRQFAVGTYLGREDDCLGT